MACPEDNAIIDFLDGHYANEEAAELEAHFDACEECRVLVAELGRTLQASNTAPASGEDWKVRSGGDLVSTGDKVGRYIIVDFIGSGAMGVVYRAYDPQLDRSIALKLVRVLSSDDEPAEHARQRLLREAKVMAKLSDPNVVTIFDASGFGDWVYLAMELVDGVDVRGWLEETSRDWRAVVRVFSAAARGLWAAHEAGIVHRDFKPANILIDRQEHVRVADFGLASMPQGAAQAPVPALARSEASGSLTVTGAVMGTPAYMSPEVRDGGVATTLSDQYSFGTSLSDALRESSPPSGIRSIVERATQAQPDQRFSSMRDVAEALEHELRGKRRRALAALAALVALGVGLALVLNLRQQSEAPPCGDAEAQFAGIWDSATKTSVHDAFVASGDLNAEAAFSSVSSSFDGYSEKWQASFAESCEATHVTHQQSQLLSDRRMHCLQSELDRFREIVAAVEAPTESMIRNAAEIAGFRNNLHYCNNVEALLREKPIPHPETAERVAELTKELRVIEAMVATTSTHDDLDRLKALAKNASDVGYPRLEAEVQTQLGHAHWRRADLPSALQALHSAVTSSEASRSPDIKIKAMTAMIAIVGGAMARHDEGLRIAQFAEATLSANPDPALLGEFLNSRAGVFLRRGDYKRAEQGFHRAYDILLEEHGPRHHRLGGILSNLAIVLSFTPKKEEEALGYYDRALAFEKKNKGSLHPDVALVLGNRSSVYADLGRHAEGLSDLREALQIRKKSLGETHPETLDNYRNLGKAHVAIGSFAEAHEALLEGARLAQHGLPADDITHANFASDIGRALLGLNKKEEAIASFEAAIEGWELAAKTQSLSMTDRYSQAMSHYALSGALWASDPKRSITLVERAVTLLGDDHPREAQAMKGWLDSVR